MVDLKVVEKGSTPLPDQEIIARLRYELERNAKVWNKFAGVIIDGYLPTRTGLAGREFEGSDQEKIAQLYKIRDVEARRYHKVLGELGLKESNPNFGPIYDELSAQTEITSTNYKPLL